MNNIGNQLKQARLMRKIDQDKLALLAGLSVETIAAIEDGAFDVPVSILGKLSDILRWSFAIGDMSI
ncbi:MAG: helix-turn-helix transcriptional regulator [Bacillota bacterium]|nr:helix-turn-helix transcriptional regulator [Bacillota bacterium]